MELVTSFNNLICPFQIYGLQKIAMNYYYCKDCDKEEKFPMCEICLTKCHRGHTQGEFHEANEDDPVRCTCAMNNHQTTVEEGNYSLFTCYFSDLNKVKEISYCYQNSHKKQICDFCYNFCRNGSKDEQEFQLEFKKVEINSGGIVNCQCPSFKNSRHTAVDFMNKCLGDINKNNENYFPNMSPVILINMFFESDELFRSVHKKFIDVFNEIMVNYNDHLFLDENENNLNEKNNNNNNDQYMKIPVVISRTYLIFSKNARNCKFDKSLIFSKKINNYFNDKVLKYFLKNYEIGVKSGKDSYSTDENFYEAFLYGYKIFNILSKIFKNSLPKFKLIEFINLNPFQRLLIQKDCNKFKFEVEFIMNITKTLIKNETNFFSVKIILQLLNIIKIFSRFYLVKIEEINDFLKILEIFFINFENIKNRNEESKLFIKIFYNIVKILIFFSFYINDMCIFNNIFESYKFIQNSLNSKEKIESYQNEKNNNFLYFDSEISRNISKILIHITKFFEIEYQNMISNDLKDKQLYYKIMDLIQILINLFFNKKDIYSSGIKRLINPELKTIADYLLNFNQKENEFLFNEINNQNNLLIQKLIEFYTSSKESNEIILSFKQSVLYVFILLDLNNGKNLNFNEIEEDDEFSVTNITNNEDFSLILSSSNVSESNKTSNQTESRIVETQSFIDDQQNDNKKNILSILNNTKKFDFNKNTTNKTTQNENNNNFINFNNNNNNNENNENNNNENNENSFLNTNNTNNKLIQTEENFNRNKKKKKSTVRFKDDEVKIFNINNNSLTSNKNTNDFSYKNKIIKKKTSLNKINITNDKLKVFELNNYLFSLSKIFCIYFDNKNNNLNVHMNKFCQKVLFLFKLYINSNPENTLQIINNQIILNLMEMPFIFYPKIFGLIKIGILNLIKNQCEIGTELNFIKLIIHIFETKVKQCDDVRLQTNCISKLLQILNLLNKIKKSFNIKWIRYIEEKIFLNNEFTSYIKQYKLYLLEISADFSLNFENYYQKKTYYNTSIYSKFFGNIKPKTMFKIAYYYLQYVTDCFEGNINLNSIEFIKDILNPSEILLIMKITTLDINLRILFIKIFRMINIDTLIENKKLNLYRTEFQNNIDERLEETLFDNEQSKIFKFYDMLMSVNPPKINDEEYEFLLQESILFKKIINESNLIQILKIEKNYITNFSKNEDFYNKNDIKNDIYLSEFTNSNEFENVFLRYFLNGVVLPIIIYLYKLFSIIHNFKGKDLLKIYKLTYKILIMMKEYNYFYNNDFKDYLHINIDNINNNINNEIRYKITKTFTNVLFKNTVENDIQKLVNEKISPLNYYYVFKIIVKNLLNIFIHPKPKKVKSFEDEFKFEQEFNVEELKLELEKKNIKLEKFSYSNELFELYFLYINNKYKFELNCHKGIFDLNYPGKENSFRTVLCKYLLLLLTDEYNVYQNDSLNFLLELLINETRITQNAIIELYNNNEFTKFYVVIEKAFTNILSTILTEFNPCLNEFNDDYYTSCSMIKLFKYLCEEHNQFFQKFFLKQYYFSLNDIQKIGFYDMFLFILEKIIILSRWKQVKKPEDFQNYFVLLFSCIIELLIEIIQGTEESNFLSLINQKYEGNQKLIISANRMDPVLKKGKALDSFLKCVKGIIVCDDQNCEELDKIRKLLMDFFLAFMEENHCPMEIKFMIIINFHASNIIKSIATILKKIVYAKRNKEKILKINNNNNNHVNEIIKKIKTLININTGNKSNKKNVNKETSAIKELNSIYFNYELFKEFNYLYLNDEEFFNNPSFQLCCSFYNYFKLTLLKCKDSETQAFWNKINSLKRDDLEQFNQLTQNNTFISDATDFEAYYIVKLFEIISVSVLVKVNEEKPPIVVIFTKPQCLNYLSEQTKENFLLNVNRTSRNTKLIDLMEQSEYFKIEAEYNFKKLRNNPFMKVFSWMNYYYFSLFVYLVDTILNIFMLTTNHESGMILNQNDNGKYYYKIIRIISLFFCFIILFIMIIWSYAKSELYKKIEIAKYLHSKQLSNENLLTFYDKLIIIKNSYLSHNELKYLIIFFIFRILGSINIKLAFCYSFSLIGAIPLNETLNILPVAFFLKGRQLSWVTAFTFITLYVYSGWGFYYLKNKFYDTDNREIPENMCHSLLYCFLTHIINGFRWYPGIGKVLRIDSAILHNKEYIHNYIYHFTFYLIVRVMMIKIVFGIIFESFTELRDIKNNKERDWSYRCFICNIEKDECEKQNEDFYEHCNRIHNVWDYACYIIMLKMADFQDLNGINAICKEMILEKQPKWVPDKEQNGDNE